MEYKLGGTIGAIVLAHYLFVDGSYLSRASLAVSKRCFGGEVIPIDPRNLAGSYRKTFYYDCPVPRQSKETEAEHATRSALQRRFFEALRQTRGVHVVEGTTTGDPPRRQKEIDVAIAVDMLTHSHQQTMTDATLLTGDRDFKPLVDALVRAGTFVTIWSERSSASKDLVLAADNREPLNAAVLHAMSTDHFRAKHSLPRGLNAPFVDRGRPLRTGTTSGDRTVRLYQERDEYVIVWPDGQNSSRENSFFDLDLTRLEAFVRDSHIEFDWVPGSA